MGIILRRWKVVSEGYRACRRTHRKFFTWKGAQREAHRSNSKAEIHGWRWRYHVERV